MKKRLLAGVLLGAFFCGSYAFAAGTCAAPTLEHHKNKNNEWFQTYTWSWTSSAGGQADCTAASDVHGYIVRVVTDPGATAPTDDYDIVINDQDGVDVMGGMLADRDTSNTEQQIAQINTLNTPIRIDGTLTPVVTAAGNAKVGEIILYLQP